MDNGLKTSEPPRHKEPGGKGKRRSSSIERHALTIAIVLVAFLAFVAVFATEKFRYTIAMNRIELERALAEGAQTTERLRIEKAATLAAAQSAPANASVGAGGAAGLELLRELIAKGVPIAGGGGVQSDKRSTNAIASLVDIFASLGQITASEAKSLKDDLQKAGIDIGVDAAKALIDRFIKVHDEPHFSGDTRRRTFEGATQVNMYCGTLPIRTAPPQPPLVAPKKSCSAK